MEVKYVSTALTERNKADILEILRQCDREFCPPLSARKNSHQSDLSGGDGEGGGIPREYFESICEQEFLLALDGDRVVGFLTFRHRYNCPDLEGIKDSLYMTTACILPEKRRMGLTSAFYTMVEDEIAPRFGYHAVTGRTWSTNAAQMHALPARGYKAVKTLKDDRGPGIDTVYFAKFI